MSDDTPTQRFDQQPAASASGERRKRSPLIPILITAGAILLVAVVVLVVVLVTRPTSSTLALNTNSPSPSVTPTTPVVNTPSPTPTPTPSHSNAPPPPQNPDAAFTLFAPDLSKYSCSAGPYYSGPTPIVKIKWATVRAKSAWIVQGTSDAADSGFMQIPLSGNQSNFPSELDLACDPPTSTFTITLVGNDGKHVSKSWTVHNAHPTG
jgi:hypothetical protein